MTGAKSERRANRELREVLDELCAVHSVLVDANDERERNRR